MAIRDQFGYTKKVVPIGTWDMNVSVAGSSTVDVAHGLSATEWKTIVNLEVMIEDDADTVRVNLMSLSGTSLPSDVNGSIIFADSTNIRLAVSTTGDFDNTSYDGSGNRGTICFNYIAD